jgi:peptidoglycan/LPS O-acetylase OafA/YrhL
LDGLRGLAVMAVVIAHFELPSGYGSGGMVGVDVFFALSGFLITTLVCACCPPSGCCLSWLLLRLSWYRTCLVPE